MKETYFHMKGVLTNAGEVDLGLKSEDRDADDHESCKASGNQQRVSLVLTANAAEKQRLQYGEYHE